MLTTTLLSLLLTAGLAQSPQTSLTIRADQPTVQVNPGMFGIFFEEINQAGDGGIYAELIRARGLEDGDAQRLPSGWRAEGTGVSLDPTTMPDPVRAHSLKIERTGPHVSAVNEGYWGIPLEAGKRYRLTIWSQGSVPIRASLESSTGSIHAQTAIKASPTWARSEVLLKPTSTDPKSLLRLTPTAPGTVHVAYASLMPVDTFKERPNGLRKDLASLVDAMKPGFVRFPGGCFIEGHTLAQAFDWKKSIGPVEQRPTNPRSFWGYPITNGLGYHEYLQWCEDMGTEALFVANCGMSHTEVAPMDQMGRYVQDTLDAIEYALGPASSKWGSVRAKNGRTKPFRLRYVQIGNENGGPAYDERYALMAKAIEAKYPQVELIACVWGGVPTSHPLQIIDEHYYNTPAFFWRQKDRYDRYDRKGPKVYVGEYAVTQGSGTGNLAAALSEAAFMTGMLRNADVVRMASYAPLFVNVKNRQWNPNAIVFDGTRSYGTPSYWVQWLFGNHRPTRMLATAVQASVPEVPPLTGRIGLTTWRTQAEFKELELTADGKTLFAAPDLNAGRVEPRSGDWKFENGILTQSAEGEDRRMFVRDVQLPPSQKITLRVKARKLSGDEGFIIVLGSNPDHEFQWNLGGWGNTLHAFQRNGERTRGVEGKIETGRWYDIRIEREGKVSRAYLDGQLIETTEDVGSPDFAAAAGVDEVKREIVVFAVNGQGAPRPLDLRLEGAQVGSTARGWVLQGTGLQEENSFEAPELIRPYEFTQSGIGPETKLSLAPYSVTVLRIPMR